MELAMIGLGKMGANMTRRLMRGGHRVVAYDRSRAIGQELATEGATAAPSLADAIQSLKTPRIVWLMVPSGAPTQTVLDELRPLLQAGDCVVDGGNTDWRDDEERAATFAAAGIAYVDCGTSAACTVSPRATA